MGILKFGYTIYPEPAPDWGFESWCESEQNAKERAVELLKAPYCEEFGIQRVRITRNIVDIEDPVCVVYLDEIKRVVIEDAE